MLEQLYKTVGKEPKTKRTIITADTCRSCDAPCACYARESGLRYIDVSPEMCHKLVDYQEYDPLTPAQEKALEELIRRNGGFWLDATMNTECWQYSSKRPKYSSNWFADKQDALASLLIKLIDWHDETFLRKVKEIIR